MSTTGTPEHDKGAAGRGRRPGVPGDDGGPDHPTHEFPQVAGGDRPQVHSGGPAGGQPAQAAASGQEGPVEDEPRGTARVPGMPSASPWQRSHAVWHRAGIDWVHAEAEPARAAATGSVTEPPPPPPPDDPSSQAAAGVPPTEPWSPTGRSRRGPSWISGKPAAVVGAAVAVVVVLGVGGYALLGGGGDEKPKTPPAVRAGRIFPVASTAETDGRAQDLVDIATDGGTVVAVGSEVGGDYSRGQFFVSTDGGRSWRLAQVKAADGGRTPPGEYPELVAGGSGGWAALGGSADATTAVWTSRDARTWTRQHGTAGFAPGDHVTGLARTSSGFVAVGTAASGTDSEDTTPAVWTSTNGGSWRRLPAGTVKPPSGAKVTGLSRVVAHGDDVVVHGTVSKTKVVKKKEKKGKKKKKHKVTVTAEGFWRSADGGRGWSPVSVPQAQGSSGSVTDVVATPAGFFATREAKHTTGKKKHKKTEHYAVVFTSPDGRSWKAVGRLKAKGYASMAGLGGSPKGLVALVSVSGGKTAAYTGADGKTWRHTGDIAAADGRELTGVAATSLGAVAIGHQGGGTGQGAYLTVAGVGDIDLTSVKNAVHPERTIAHVTTASGLVVAVGSTNGDAAVWTSRDGATWTRARLSDDGASGTGLQRLTDVVRGAKGWLAVGRTGDDPGHPLVVTSADGITWKEVTAEEFSAADDAELVPWAVTHGSKGYVAVGVDAPESDVSSAAVWFSPDGATWQRGGNAGEDDLDGHKAMRDVVSGPFGYVAVGSRIIEDGDRPGVWTSVDGKTWTLGRAPALPRGTTSGVFDRIVAKGNTLVATGTASTAQASQRPRVFAALSVDGGKSWKPVSLPDAAPGSAVTAATATPHGFVLAGTVGAAGRSDVTLWTSADGRTWKRSRPHGTGLDGAGVQRLNALTVVGKRLVGIGFTGDYRTDEPTLWQPPLP